MTLLNLLLRSLFTWKPLIAILQYLQFIIFSFPSTKDSTLCSSVNILLSSLRIQKNTSFTFFSTILSILWHVFLNFQYLQPLLMNLQRYFSLISFQFLIIFFNKFINFDFSNSCCFVSRTSFMCLFYYSKQL